jgi:hypothetical protein
MRNKYRIAAKAILSLCMVVAGLAVGYISVRKDAIKPYADHNTFEIQAILNYIRYDDELTSNIRKKYSSSSKNIDEQKGSDESHKFNVSKEEFRNLVRNIENYKVYRCGVTLKCYSSLEHKGGYFVAEQSLKDPIYINSDVYAGIGIDLYPDKEQTGEIYLFLPVESDQKSVFENLVIRAMIKIRLPGNMWCSASFRVPYELIEPEA